MTQIPTDQLTDEEIALLEARGVDTSRAVVDLSAQQDSSSSETPPATPEAETGGGKKPIPAPTPGPDVIERVNARVEAQKEMEGPESTYEIKDENGRVIERKGSVRPGEPEEDPIETVDKEAFLLHVLGAERFRRSYDLFGGRLSVTFQTRTVEEDEACASQSFFDEQLDGGYPGNTPDMRAAQRMQRYCDYQFVASLREIQTKGAPPRVFEPFNAPTDESYPLKAARERLNAEFGQALKVALRQAHNRFESLVARMTAEAASPDFFQAGSDI